MKNPAYEHQWQWLALFISDPVLRERWRRALLSSPRFSHVNTINNWLLATKPLGATPATSPRLRSLTSGGTLCVINGASEIEKAAGGFPRFEEYSQHAPTRLGEFPGDFSSFSLFPEGRALLQRSVSGIPALYAAQGPEFCALGTNIDWLRLSLPHSPAIDWLPVALYTAGWPAFPEGRCPLQDVHLLPRGHFLDLRRGRPLIPLAYWAPPATNPSRSQDAGYALAESIRDSLDRDLSCHLSKKDENMLLYSGGLDSAVVAATARFLGFPLQALSVAPPDSSPEQSRERSYHQALSAWFTQHKTCTLDSPSFLEIYQQSLPAYYPVPPYFTLAQLYGLSPKVITAGWFADEMLGVFRYPDLFEGASRGDLPGLVARTPLGTQAVQRWYSYRHGQAVPWVPSRISRTFGALLGDEYREWYVREVLFENRERPPVERSFPLTDRALVLSESAARLGATLAMPFFSRRLMEAAFAAHPSLLFSRKFTKVPLRSAMAGRLPREFLERSDSGNFSLGVPLTELPQVQLSRMLTTLHPLLDKVSFRGQIRLNWDDQFDLCTVSRVSENHQALTYERQQLLTQHQLPFT